MLCQYLECKWSDAGNRFKKGNVRDASQYGIVGNIICWASKDSFNEIKSLLVKAAVFISHWDLHNHSVIIAGLYSGFEFRESACTFENIVRYF